MTERRILTSEPTSSYRLGEGRNCGVQGYANMKAQCKNMQKTVYVPIYISASMKELVLINLADKKVKASFSFYISVFTDIKEEVFEALKSNEIASSEQLRHFLENNLQLEIGGKFVDIFHIGTTVQQQADSQRGYYELKTKRRATIQQIDLTTTVDRHSVSIEEEEEYIVNAGQDFDEEQQYFDDQFFTKKLHSSKRMRCSNHFISGIFDCDSQLSSGYFPYHQIYSNLTIRVNNQYYKDVMIRYKLVFPQEYLQSNQQFNFIFPSLQLAKFGIYSVDLDYHEVKSQSIVEKLGEINKDIYSQVTNISFCFKSICFNISFVLRNEVPLWNLCFASLMLYFTKGSDISSIYGNAILLSISFIFLLTNFRRSIYSSNSANLYEFTISTFIVANFLLIIHSTNNYYGKNNAENEINSKGPFLLISIALTSFAFFLNVLFMIIFAVKTKKPKKYLPDKSRQLLQDVWIEQQFNESNSQNSNVPFFTRPNEGVLSNN